MRTRELADLAKHVSIGDESGRNFNRQDYHASKHGPISDQRAQSITLELAHFNRPRSLK